MANSVPFRTTPQLGAQLNNVYVGMPYWDQLIGITEPSYRLGNRESGNDGHVYIWVKAGDAEIAKDTEVTIDEETWIATAGAGGATTPADTDVPAGAYFHARVTAL